MHSVLSLVAASIAFSLLAAAAPPPNQVTEDWGWTKLGPAHPTVDTINFTITLKWQNQHLLDDWERVATDQAEDYQYDATRAIEATRTQTEAGAPSILATLGAWRKVLAPSDSDRTAVRAYLAKHTDTDKYCPEDGWDHIKCRGVPAEHAERIFRLPLARWQHKSVAVARRPPYTVFAADRNAGWSNELADAIAVGTQGAARPAHVTELAPTPVDVSLRYKQQTPSSSLSSLEDRAVGGLKAAVGQRRSFAAAQKEGASNSNDWLWPHPATGQQVITNYIIGTVNASQESVEVVVIVALFCSDGTALARSQFTGAVQCAAGATGYPPDEISVFGQVTRWDKIRGLETKDLVPPQVAKELPDAVAREFSALLRVTVPAIKPWSELPPLEVTATFRLNGQTTTTKAYPTNFRFADYQTNTPNVQFPSAHPNRATAFAEEALWAPDIGTLVGVDVRNPGVGRSATISQGVWELSQPGQPTEYLTGDVDMYLAKINANTGSSGGVTYIGSLEGVSAGEATLDIELIMGMAQGVKTAFMTSACPTSGQLSLASALLVWLQDLSSGWTNPNLPMPSVWSMSYGQYDQVFSGSVHQASAYFRLMTGSGVTFVASSGDAGSEAGGVQGHYTATNFPASSPYVLSVGAVALRASPAVAFTTAGGSETTCTAHAAEMITSSGGFSKQFPRSLWQPTLYMSSGRAVPDIAAVGSNIAIIQNSKTQSVFGTSASAPIAAAMITLTNNNRYPAPTMTLAPMFPYLRTNAFNDVTSGNNCYSKGQGFASLLFDTLTDCYEANAGWDATTGVGSVSVRMIEGGKSWTNPTLVPLTPAPPSPPTKDSRAYYYGAGAGVAVVIAAVVILVVFAVRRRANRAVKQQQAQGDLQAMINEEVGENNVA